jgi:hypothetical protein
MVESNDTRGVGIQVLGTDRSGFPGYFGFMTSFEEIKDFRARTPSNLRETSFYVAYPPNAQTRDVKSALQIELGCLWNFHGCSATKQLLPILWQQKMELRNNR